MHTKQITLWNVAIELLILRSWIQISAIMIEFFVRFLRTGK